ELRNRESWPWCPPRCAGADCYLPGVTPRGVRYFLFCREQGNREWGNGEMGQVSGGGTSAGRKAGERGHRRTGERGHRRAALLPRPKPGRFLLPGLANSPWEGDNSCHAALPWGRRLEWCSLWPLVSAGSSVESHKTCEERAGTSLNPHHTCLRT